MLSLTYSDHIMLKVKSSPLFALLVAGYSFADEGFKIEIPDSVPDGFESIVKDNGFYDIYLDNNYIKTFRIDLGGINKNDANRIILKRVFSSLGADYSSLNVDNYFHRVEGNEIYVFKKIKSIDNHIKSGFSWSSSLSGDNYVDLGGGNGSKYNIVSNSSFSYNSLSGQFTAEKRGDDLSGVTSLSLSNEIFGSRLVYGHFSPVQNAFSRINFNKITGIEYLHNSLKKESYSRRDPLIITATSAATARIERDGKLLKLVNIDIGRNEIQTDKLPNGNYEVDVVINYYNGQLESRKMNVGGVYGKGGYGFTGVKVGYKGEQFLNETDFSSDNLVISSGYSFPEFNNSNFSIDVGYDEEFVVNPTYLYMDGPHNAQASYKISDNSEEVFLGINKSSSRYSINGNYVYAYSPTQIRNNIQVNTSYVANERNVLYFSYDRDMHNDKDYFSLMHSFVINRNNTHSLMLNTSFVRGNETFFGFNLSYRLNPRGSSYRYSSVIDYQREIVAQQSLSNINEFNRSTIQNNATVIINDESTGGFLRSTFDSSDIGRVSAELGSIRGGGDSNNYLNGSFNFKFIGDNDNVKLIGRNATTTGVVIDLEKDDKESLYALNIDGRERNIKGGKSYVVPLRPHSNYKLKLSSKSNPNVSIADSVKEIYLHKNNLYFPDWRMIETKLAYGSLYLDGSPVRGAHVSTDISQGYTDGEGNFLLEMSNNSSKIIVNNKECDIINVEGTVYNVSC